MRSTFLREYRTRLVSQVVTGKLDVREAAASLPDLQLETEALAPDLIEDLPDLGRGEMDVPEDKDLAA